MHLYTDTGCSTEIACLVCVCVCVCVYGDIEIGMVGNLSVQMYNNPVCPALSAKQMLSIYAM